tara:strand:- start:330 stop:614 length:285 start_codon:yes stop_codon:yes gene_type:complete
MSQNKDVILKIKELIELRHRTIVANKKAMKGHLVEYKKALELDKEIKLEIKTLNKAINLLQYGNPVEDFETEEVFNSENIAFNRDEHIYTGDEE